MTKLVTLYLILVSWWDAGLIRPLAARWAARATELVPQPTAGGRHQATEADLDDKWAKAIKRMAARMEASHAWR